MRFLSFPRNSNRDCVRGLSAALAFSTSFLHCRLEDGSALRAAWVRARRCLARCANVNLLKRREALRRWRISTLLPGQYSAPNIIQARDLWQAAHRAMARWKARGVLAEATIRVSLGLGVPSAKPRVGGIDAETTPASHLFDAPTSRALPGSDRDARGSWPSTLSAMRCAIFLDPRSRIEVGL